MDHSKALQNIVNSLETEFFMCGTTRITEMSHAKYLAKSHIQPFILVTQITEGPLLLQIGDAAYRIDPGQALIVPAHVSYFIQLLGESAVTHWLNMNYTLFDHFSIFDFIETPVVAPVSVGNQIGRFQAEIVELMEPVRLDPAAALIAGAKVKQRLISVLETMLSISRYKHGSLENMNAIKRFNPVFKYIEEHLAEKIKVSHLAKLMYLSTSHFHKEFQGAFDFSPMQYIQSQRLKKAQLLLTTSSATVREIAGLVGYDNAFAFIRFFKSMVGESPGNYRKTIFSDLSERAGGEENGKAK